MAEGNKDSWSDGTKMVDKMAKNAVNVQNKFLSQTIDEWEKLNL